jgi:hypothetical protein
VFCPDIHNFAVHLGLVGLSRYFPYDRSAAQVCKCRDIGVTLSAVNALYGKRRVSPVSIEFERSEWSAVKVHGTLIDNL